MEKEIEYLEKLSWNPSKVGVVPGSNKEFIEKMSGLVGFANACKEIEDREGVETFGEGSYVVLIAWIKKNGLHDSFEEIRSSGSYEEPMDISFEGRLQRAKEISGNAPVDSPSIPDVPEVPPVEQETVKEEPKGEPEPKPEGRSFDKYVERVKYLGKLGLEFDVHVDGYISKDKKSFVSAVAVKSFESETDAQYMNYVRGEMEKEFRYPDPLKESKEEPVAKSELPDITEGLGNKKKEEPIVEASDAQIEERYKLLADWGFKKNPQTYRWTFSEDIFISHSVVSNRNNAVWKEWLDKNIEGITKLQPPVERTEEVPVDDPVDTINPEADEIDREDLDAPAEMKYELVIKAKKSPLVDMKKMLHNTGTGKISDLDEVFKEDVEEQEDQDDQDVGQSFENLSKVEGNTNFFQQLYGFNFRTLALNFTRLEKEGQVNVTVTPQPFEDDPAFKEMASLNIKADVADLDKNFFKVISKPLKEVERIFTNSDEFLKAAREAEKKTRAAKEKADAIDKAEKDLEKYLKADKQTEATLTKKVDDLLELDPKNKLGLEQQEKLKQGKLM